MSILKRDLLLLLLSMVIFNSCQRENCNCETDYDTVKSNKILFDSLYLESESLGDYLFKNYALQYLNRSNDEQYRLVIHGLLSDKHYVYTIIDKNGRLHFTEQLYTNTNRGYSKLMLEHGRALNEEEVRRFNNVIQNSCIQNIPIDIVDDDNYLDGSFWVLELSNVRNCENIGYISAYRNSPDNSDFLNIANEILDLAKEIKL